jgi:chromosome segregation ATPase
LKKKAITDNLKLLSNDIGHLRNIKDEVGLKKQLGVANNCMNVNRDQIDKYNRKLDLITERINIINAREADITKLYTEKEKKKTELEGVKAAQMELEQNIQSKFKGLTSELEAFIKTFHVEMKLKETCRSDLTPKLSHLENEDKELQVDITREEVKKGQFQKEVEQQQERIDSRNKLLSKLAEDLEMSETISAAAASFTQFSEGEVTSVLGQVNRKVKAIEAALEAQKGMMEDEKQNPRTKFHSPR